jgi:imidazole glycerol-phosphate synthase subunit HisH
MIALVDYKAGNLTSVRKALGAVGAQFFTPETAADLDRASAIIVPGVGHFGATRNIDTGWVSRITAAVAAGRPLLGICVGMQWLYESSAEAPDLVGFSMMGGACVRLSTADRQVRLKVPHVGWNSLDIRRQDWIVDGVPNGSQVYFTHSYAPPVTADTVATATHGNTFTAVVQRGHVAGVQFHPEKSGDVGLRILRNFVERVG